MKESLGIYIHIPFCVRKCNYCDFLSGPATKDVQKDYVKKLLEEIDGYKELLKNRKTDTIFFGGGTPSSIDEQDILRILEKIKAYGNISPEAEISIEANPGTVTEKKLHAWKAAGINRISFGLQSSDNEELKCLGRIHTWEEFLENYQMARQCGFDNINIDLMSALPGQTVESWNATMERVTALDPEHISAYSLIIEEGTPLTRIIRSFCRRKKKNVRCTMIQRNFWHQKAMSVMKFPIMRNQDMSADITYLIGREWIIWGLGLERLHFLAM